ncbi:MAG: hypothetical protein E7633_04205 [Ruminococcaceae bacterium]|nr:hypothetical protein [Oscillospiraceae bacterium]
MKKLMKKLTIVTLVIIMLLIAFCGCKAGEDPDETERDNYDPKYEETGDALTDIKLWLDTEGFVARMSQGTFVSILAAYEYNGVFYGETESGMTYYDGAYGGGCEGNYEGISFHNDYRWSPETKIATYYNTCTISVNLDNMFFPYGVRIGKPMKAYWESFGIDEEMLSEIDFDEEIVVSSNEDATLVFKKLDNIYWEASDRRYQITYTEKTQIMLNDETPDDVTRTMVFYFVEDEAGETVLSHIMIKVLEEYPNNY